MRKKTVSTPDVHEMAETMIALVERIRKIKQNIREEENMGEKEREIKKEMERAIGTKNYPEMFEKMEKEINSLCANTEYGEPQCVNSVEDEEEDDIKNLWYETNDEKLDEAIAKYEEENLEQQKKFDEIKNEKEEAKQKYLKVQEKVEIERIAIKILEEKIKNMKENAINEIENMKLKLNERIESDVPLLDKIKEARDTLKSIRENEREVKEKYKEKEREYKAFLEEVDELIENLEEKRILMTNLLKEENVPVNIIMNDYDKLGAMKKKIRDTTETLDLEIGEEKLLTENVNKKRIEKLEVLKKTKEILLIKRKEVLEEERKLRPILRQMNKYKTMLVALMKNEESISGNEESQVKDLQIKYEIVLFICKSEYEELAKHQNNLKKEITTLKTAIKHKRKQRSKRSVEEVEGEEIKNGGGDVQSEKEKLLEEQSKYNAILEEKNLIITEYKQLGKKNKKLKKLQAAMETRLRKHMHDDEHGSDTDEREQWLSELMKKIKVLTQALPPSEEIMNRFQEMKKVIDNKSILAIKKRKIIENELKNINNQINDLSGVSMKEKYEMVRKINDLQKGIAKKDIILVSLYQTMNDLQNKVDEAKLKFKMKQEETRNSMYTQEILREEVKKTKKESLRLAEEEAERINCLKNEMYELEKELARARAELYYAHEENVKLKAYFREDGVDDQPNQLNTEDQDLENSNMDEEDRSKTVEDNTGKESEKVKY